MLILSSFTPTRGPLVRSSWIIIVNLTQYHFHASGWSESILHCCISRRLATFLIVKWHPFLFGLLSLCHHLSFIATPPFNISDVILLPVFHERFLSFAWITWTVVYHRVHPNNSRKQIEFPIIGTFAPTFNCPFHRSQTDNIIPINHRSISRDSTGRRHPQVLSVLCFFNPEH